MDSTPKRPNKITEIVRLQQMLKKWKKLSASPRPPNSSSSSSSRGIKFLKRTLSFTDTTNTTASASAAAAAASGEVPKGYLAVCVGEELQRYVIPTEYLGHRAFEALLREAEDEFGFQQEGVLRIPCEVGVFETILTAVQKTKDGSSYYCSSSEPSQFAHNCHFSPPTNPICRVYEESVDHLFTQCIFTKYLMVTGLEDIRAGELCGDVLDAWDRWKGRHGGRGLRNDLTELAACWWTIWKARNDFIFCGTQLDPISAGLRLKQLIRSWKDFP